MAIKVTTPETKQDVKPFPKLMIAVNGISYNGTVVLFDSECRGVIVKGSGINTNDTGCFFNDFVMSDFTDYNEPLTIQNA